MTYAVVLNAFLNTYTDCDATTAAQLLNDIDEEILSVIPYRKSTVAVGLTSGVRNYTADESVIKIWDASLQRGDGTREPLTQVSESELDYKSPGWRGNPSTSNPCVFGTTENMTTGQYFVTPPPNYTNIQIASITNASPPVVTTTTVHGLSTAQRIVLAGATGTTLTGPGYVKLAGTSAFSLWQDPGLTIPFAASGTGTAGVIGTQLQPLLLLEVTQRLTGLTSTTAMPLTPTLRRLYADGMRWLWALQKHLDTAAAYGEQFEKDLALSLDMNSRRAANTPIQIRTFDQCMRFRRGGGRGRGWTRVELGPSQTIP